MPVVKTETYNLEFTVEVDERHRFYIPKDIVDIVLIKKGDKATLVLTKVHRIVVA